MASITKSTRKELKIDSSDRISILISDLTRPIPNHIIIPSILEELKKRGASENNVTIIVATGKHRVYKDKDFIQLLGKDILNQYNVISHDGENKSEHQFLGYTSNEVIRYPFTTSIRGKQVMRGIVLNKLSGVVSYYFFIMSFSLRP